MQALEQMEDEQHYLNRYFWVANVFFWLAIHALFVHLEYKGGSELTWIRTWVIMSPWFLSWILVTYAIFYVILSNDRNDNTRIRSILNHAISMVLLLLCYWAFCSGARIIVRGDDLSQFWGVFTNTLLTSSQVDVFIYFCVLALGLGLRFYHKCIQESIEVKRLQHELVNEQLKTLRTQLNPHFLFNALNTVASLVRLKRDKDAVFTLSELSSMLRKILEHKNHSNVKVKDEVDFIKSYLAIQKLRFSDKLLPHISVQPECLDLEIPSMILHPLIENAVQHGSQLESNLNPLNLEITRDENELKLLMTNKVANDDNHKGFGIGLTNTRERLSKIYTHFRLESQPLSNDLFETILAIPIGDRDA